MAKNMDFALQWQGCQSLWVWGITDQPDENTVDVVPPYILQTPSQTVPDPL
jgi:hypothetical protein